jgi:hypothetical protein
VNKNAVDQAQFRQLLGRFATGVTVITARDSDGRPLVTSWSHDDRFDVLDRGQLVLKLEQISAADAVARVGEGNLHTIHTSCTACLHLTALP